MPNRPSSDPESEPIREAILRTELPVSSPRPCPYLHDRPAREQMFSIHRLPAGVYQSLLEINFRRSGTLIYRPTCESCVQCRALRVDVGQFTPNRSQRRCRNRNRDLTIMEGSPEPTEEKYQLYRQYLARRHDREMDDSEGGFVDFLYASPVPTLEIIYRLEQRLVAVGLIDLLPTAASTVYCYFAPDLAARSLGTFNILRSIQLCRDRAIPQLHLGYFIADCPKMSYKINFKPCEILQPDGSWQESRGSGAP